MLNYTVIIVEIIISIILLPIFATNDGYWYWVSLMIAGMFIGLFLPDPIGEKREFKEMFGDNYKEALEKYKEENDIQK